MNAADLLTILKLNALTENEALQVLLQLEGQMVARARYDKTLNKRRASVPYWARWRARTGVEGRVIWRRLTPAQPGQKLVTEEGCGDSWTMALLAVLASHPALVRYPLGAEAQDAVEALYKQLHEVKEGAAP